MLTIKKRSGLLQVLAVVVVAHLTGCGPPGARDLHKGEELIQSGNYDEAISVLSDGVQVLHDASPTVQANAWNLLGLACQGAGQLDAASKAYLQALKLDRNLWAADFNLGCLRIEQTNFPGAIDYLTTYTTSHPKDVDGILLLGRARLRLAMDRFGAERSRQLEGARQDYEYAERLRSTAEACNALGLIELQTHAPSMDRVQMAASLFKLALQREPSYPPAVLNLAIVLQHYLNQPREALEIYRQYLALQPVPAQAKDVEKLIHQLDLDVRMTIVAERPAPMQPVPINAGPSRQLPAPTENPTPRSAPSLIVRAAPAEKPEAPQHFTPSPENPPAVVSAPPQVPISSPTAPVASVSPPADTANSAGGASSSESPMVQAPEEKKSFVQRLNPLNWFSSKSKKSDVTTTPIPTETGNSDRFTYPLPVLPIPGDRELAEKLTREGRQYERQANRAEAMRQYQEAMKADPTYFEAGLALGLAAIDAKEYAVASDALGQALTLEPDSSDARYAFAWVLGKRGYFQDAADELEKSISAHPREARARLLLGNFYADNLGQPKLAREQYAKALELIDPQSSQAAVIRTWLEQHP
jgi:tetratricopeptide (TPR) repeat protein